MRRILASTLTLIASLLLAIPPQTAYADCRKEILVYLDISGSMKPRNGTLENSRFLRTVEALDKLLDQPGLVQREDVVKLRLFGERVGWRDEAAGSTEIDQMIDRLRSIPDRESLSDLVEVIKDVEEELSKGDTNYDRRLVIIASDFVHDHNDQGKEDQFLADWRQKTAELENGVASIFMPSTKLAFLFLRAQTEDFPRIQTTVLSELTANNRRSEIDLDRVSPTRLTEEIQKRLLFPPEIQGWVTNGNDPVLHVTVRNLNCTSVELEEIKARCGTRGDEANLDLPSQCSALGPTGREASSCEAEKDLASLSCMLGDEIQIRASLAEGVTAAKTINAANLLQVDPTQAFSEKRSQKTKSRFLKGSVYLYIKLRGQIVEDRQYDFELKRRDTVIAAGSFELPESLSDTWQTYLFPIQVSADAIAGQQTEFEIDIPDAEMVTSKIVVTQDTFESKTNSFFNLSIFILWVFSVLYNIRSKRQWKKAKGTTEWLSSAATSAVTVLPPVALWAYDHFRISPALSSSFDGWRWILLSIGFAWISYLWIRQRRLQSIEQQIEELQYKVDDRADEEPSLETVGSTIRRVEQIANLGRGRDQVAKRAALVGLIVAVGLIGALYLLRPSAVLTPPAFLDVIQVVQY